MNAPWELPIESQRLGFPGIHSPVILGPNITGGYSFQTCRGGVYSGALISGPIYRTAYNGNNNSGNYSGVSLDASSDKATYGLSETIQPSSNYVLIIIKA